MLKVKTEKHGGATTLHFQGKIVNGAATRTLRDAVFAQSSASLLILDLAGVKVIDAGGLGALLALREWADIRGIEFRLLNVTALIQRLFKITRLDSVFTISTGKNARTKEVGASMPASSKQSFLPFVC